MASKIRGLMNNAIRYALPLFPLFVITSCDVEVGDCRQDDAGECVDLFPDEPDASLSIDASSQRDAVVDSTVADADQTVVDAGMDASGSMDAGQPADSAVPTLMTLEQFCGALNRRGLDWATKLDECCLNTQERTSAQARSILNLIGAYSEDAVDNCLRFYNGLVADGGGVTYQPQFAASCVTAFIDAYPAPPAGCPSAGFDVELQRSTVGHGAPQLAQLPACREALRGQIMAELPCARDFECAPGLTCLPIATGSDAGSRCRAPSTANGFCETNADCALGYACVGSRDFGRVCRSTQELVDTGRCEAAQECKVGKVCASGMCAAPVLGDVICRP